MNTKLLHEKIKRFTKTVNEGNLSTGFAKEMIMDFNTWVLGIEKYIETIELEKEELSISYNNQLEEIERLHKIISIIGEGKALVSSTIMDRDKFNKVIDFLFECNDRNNVGNIYAVGSLLELAEKEGRKIKNMVELVNYARGL